MEEQLHIRVWGLEPALDRELIQPVGDELERVFETPVDITTYDFEPPAAGFTEIALTIAVSGVATTLLVECFKPLVAHAGEHFRDKVLAVVRADRRSKASGRLYVPLRIELGAPPHGDSVRYTFHGRFDAEGLLLRLRAADEHIRAIPPELFTDRGGPSEVSFFWDDEQGGWRGSVWRGGLEANYGEEWVPPDLWDD